MYPSRIFRLEFKRHRGAHYLHLLIQLLSKAFWPNWSRDCVQNIAFTEYKNFCNPELLQSMVAIYATKNHIVYIIYFSFIWICSQSEMFTCYKYICTFHSKELLLIIFFPFLGILSHLEISYIINIYIYISIISLWVVLYISCISIKRKDNQTG